MVFHICHQPWIQSTKSPLCPQACYIASKLKREICCGCCLFDAGNDDEEADDDNNNNNVKRMDGLALLTDVVRMLEMMKSN